MIKKILFFDTETTGLFCKDYNDLKNMPHLIQLGYAAYKDKGSGFVLAKEVSTLVNPFGGEFKISQDAFNAHGISTEEVLEKGISTDIVMQPFLRAVEWADLVVCHNVWFDKTLALCEVARLQNAFGKDVVVNHLLSAKIFCTMKFMTDIMKLEKTGKAAYYGGFKFPKLEETHQFLFNEGFDGAHDAISDVRATARCFFEICKLYKPTF